ncbi:uncharacterized protein LOC142229870 [Haematobia irritans]|uniref:uncharacterized protein LOC142229870 n=1 Tax=Haematobia irritans TaxID=7368 RepID=UPI003F4FB3A1
MICPSRKELLAIAEICQAVLALWNYFEINIYDTPMYDIRIFEHQCVSIAICFASLYYGLGTWFWWYSKMSMTRLINRLHCILVHFVLIVLLFVTRSRYLAEYGPLIRAVFSHEIFDDEDERISFSLILMQGMLLISGIIIVIQGDYFIRRTLEIWHKAKGRE